MSSRSEDTGIIPVVQAHLRAIARWSVAKTSEHELRVASGSLRLLLCQEGVQRAWKATGLGGPVMVSAMCIDTYRPDAVVFCGGGDVLPGMTFSTAHNATLKQKTLNLTDYINRPCAILGGVKISTWELVMFVANNLGGSHYDPQGKSSKVKAAYEALRRFETGNTPGLFISAVNGVNQTHHELLSISQTILASREIQNLITWTPKNR